MPDPSPSPDQMTETPEEAAQEILPCLFCGKEQDADSFYYNGPGPPPSYAVQCGWCGARGECRTGSFRHDHEGARRAAVESWNMAHTSAEERGAARERERCAMTAANFIAVDGHIFHGMGIRSAERLGDALADKLRRGGDNEGARPITPKDLFNALRLGVEGSDEDRAMYLRVMSMRYQHVEGLGKLAAKYHDPLDILRARSGNKE